MKASELKRGMIIKENGELFAIIEMEHRTPGNLRAIYQATMKSVLGEKLINKRFSPGDSVEKVDLEGRKAQYQFSDHSGYHFMDMETYDTVALSRELVGSSKDYLKENIEVEILYYEHLPVSLDIPVSVSLKIIESAPGAKGDTSGRALKPAKLETGLVVNVPLFIEEGETILVDSRTGEYLGRA